MSNLATPTDVQQPVRRHKLSVDDFHKLGEAGVLHEDSRVELIRQLEVFRDPSPEGYRARPLNGSGAVVSPLALPELSVEVATLF
jgi:Uma2 family endonuclease